jgi:hypothetical protein
VINVAIFFRQHSLAIIFAAGLVLVLTGLLFAIWHTPHPNIAAVLISIGASLIAASLTTFLSPVTEEVYQRFLKMGVTEIHSSRRDIDQHQWCEWLQPSSIINRSAICRLPPEAKEWIESAHAHNWVNKRSRKRNIGRSNGLLGFLSGKPARDPVVVDVTPFPRAKLALTLVSPRRRLEKDRHRGFRTKRHGENSLKRHGKGHAVGIFRLRAGQ